MLHAIHDSGNHILGSSVGEGRWNVTDVLQVALTGVPRIIAKDTGELLFASRAAEQMLSRYSLGEHLAEVRLVRWLANRPEVGKRLIVSIPNGELSFTCVSWLPEELLLPISVNAAACKISLVAVEERSVELLKERGMACGLTLREAEVLAWIAFGKSSPEIGTILTRSTRTIEKHCQNSFEKLGVSTRLQAVALLLSGE